MTLALAVASLMRFANAATFDDIQFWAGSGTNRAALAIDWKDGKSPQSFLWGYRWNGTATGLDMLQAVVAADSRLFAHLGQFGWGTALFGIGYDQNNSRDFGANPALVFDAGGLVMDTGASNADDARGPADAADHFVEGWDTGFWAYYVKDSATNGWGSAMTGADGRILADGAWDGFSFAAGFVSSEPGEPAPAAANPFAFEVVAAQEPFGASPYDDPASVLGMPSTNFYDPWGGWSGGTTERRVKLVEPAYNLDATQTRKLITTLPEGSSIMARFEQPIYDDPANPYGVDFAVFGNAFYTASGFVNDSADMNTLLLAGGVFAEPTKVSVSPGYTGKAGQDPANSATWDWYRYDNGPYADGVFPTHAYRWNRASATWSNELMDFTKPVNPALGTRLNSGDTETLSAADAIDLYDGSGGGTGFDLAQSGFTSVQYVKVEGLTDFSGGEIDAISASRPRVVGDSLTIAPGNLTNGTATLRFQRPGKPAQPALAVSFTTVSEVARISTAALPDPSLFAPYGRLLTGAQLGLAPVLGSNTVPFQADVRLASGPDYAGNGDDLVLLRQVGSDWEDAAFAFEASTRGALVAGITNLPTLALLQAVPPQLAITRGVDDLGGPQTKVQFASLPGFIYTLERTTDFVNWEEMGMVRPLALGMSSLFYGDEATSAFYRIRVNRP